MFSRQCKTNYEQVGKWDIGKEGVGWAVDEEGMAVAMEQFGLTSFPSGPEA